MINSFKSGCFIQQAKGCPTNTESLLIEKHIIEKPCCSECRKDFKRLSPKIIKSLDLMIITLPEFVMAVLHSLKPINLRHCKEMNGEILEAVWQKEFYRAAT